MSPARPETATFSSPKKPQSAKVRAQIRFFDNAPDTSSPDSMDANESFSGSGSQQFFATLPGELRDLCKEERDWANKMVLF